MKPIYRYLPMDKEALVGTYTEEKYTTSKGTVVQKHDVTIIHDVLTSITTPVLCELRNSEGEVKGYAYRTFEE